MKKLFEKQVARATRPDGGVDVVALGRLVVQAYDEAEKDRERTDRSINLMVGELSALQAGLKSEIAAQTAALRKSRKALRLQNTLFSAALENMAQGLSMFDKDEKLVICNRKFLELYGLPKSCARKGTTYRAILEARVRAGTWFGDDAATFVEKRLALARSGDRVTAVRRHKSGRVLSIGHQPMQDGGWISTHTDVTDLHELQDELAHLAYYDALTDLPNRNLLLQRLGQALAEPAEGLGLLLLDLDGFKTVNDTMGHASGDLLLREVAGRLGGSAGPADLVGRLGGDEFAILLPGADAPKARAVAGAIIAGLRLPFDIGPQRVKIAASVGIALAPQDGTDPDTLMRSADTALYAAKHEGRGGFRFFEADMDRDLQERRRTEKELTRAIENGEFEVDYQPILDLRTQTFSGFEALLRWRHPTRGLIPPGQFIPLAEQLGLIAPIGEWVMREAFSEAARWPSDLKVAVNVSSVQFDRGNLVAIVMNALAAAGLPPHRADIEITESVFLANTQKNLEILHQLHMLGIGISLDDFGTGYSALSYLLSFPFNKIKIDGSFVRALDSADGAIAILKAVSDISGRMGMISTAEGVETPEQLRKVHAMGYTEVQGYLISRPIPRDELRRLLREWDAMEESPMPWKVAM